MHHWCHSGLTPSPDKYFGFVYIIINHVNKRVYIGKKQYHFKKGRRKAGNKNKTWTKIDSDWKFYTGSSTGLTKDVGTYGHDNFTYRIIAHYHNKGDLRYGEFMEMVLRRALTDTDYYNLQFEAMRYVPKQVPGVYHGSAQYRGT